MSKQLTRPQSKQERRRERREEQRRREGEQARVGKRRRLTLWSSLAVLLIVVSTVVYFAYFAKSPPQANGASSGQSGTATGGQVYQAIDGVTCDAGEQLVYHIHAHLSIYIKGQPLQLPKNIGIASDSSCIYWMHTHADDGILHIEAPKQQFFKLGNFLHLWGGQFPQLKYPLELEQTSGWQAYVDGKPYTGDFRTIELTSHKLITIAYQSPNVKPDSTYSWGDLTQ